MKKLQNVKKKLIEWTINTFGGLNEKKKIIWDEV